jgi:hypothetical protein
VPPQSTKVVDVIVDLCAQVEAQMGALRRDYQISIYEVCLGLNRQISKDMDRMIYHIRRLIDQNGFLYDRVVELEKNNDGQKPQRQTHHETARISRHGPHAPVLHMARHASPLLHTKTH